MVSHKIIIIINGSAAVLLGFNRSLNFLSLFSVKCRGSIFHSILSYRQENTKEQIHDINSSGRILNQVPSIRVREENSCLRLRSKENNT
jgi:hypothetical protein